MKARVKAKKFSCDDWAIREVVAKANPDLDDPFSPPPSDRFFEPPDALNRSRKKNCRRGRRH